MTFNSSKKYLHHNLASYLDTFSDFLFIVDRLKIKHSLIAIKVIF